MSRYEPRIDISSVQAIDMHVHVERDHHGCLSLDQELMDASAAYFRSSDNRTPTVADLAERYRAADMAAVVFTVDAATATGHPTLSSEDIAEQAAEHADVLIPFGSVDPHRGAAAIAQAQRLVGDHGVRGFKFHPSLQAFSPDEESFRPLWAALQELAVPVVFHTGQNGIGAGLPGGRGIKLKYSNPILLDEVAADFPGLEVILAHPSVPWQAEAIAMAVHKANVHIDLSGWAPRYFPAELVRAAGGMLRHKVLFGSDYPLIAPERWIREFRELGLREEVLPGILKDNAVALLGLAGAGEHSP
ncbi:amidohydrolase family protein [Kineosporia rhizophila]|uniref:amidohydrolase family protein n=1 Tax=Kineosporia rhizophila TaxID=84633 RepID=UPI001E51A02B|nr:amidohydrolase family protein [Kineosporia rhizophila]MCE0537985.1 amidohydrolase family protein [Kineosporia rhizophila]